MKNLYKNIVLFFYCKVNLVNVNKLSVNAEKWGVKEKHQGFGA